MNKKIQIIFDFDGVILKAIILKRKDFTLFLKNLDISLQKKLKIITKKI